MNESTKTSGNSTVSIESSLKRFEQHHRSLLAELANIGLALRGSIGLRLNRCGNPTCRCKADPPMLHGPYYVDPKGCREDGQRHSDSGVSGAVRVGGSPCSRAVGGHLAFH